MKLPLRQSKRQVNLLPKDAFEGSVVGRILVWALSFGKWLVIVTQLIVIGVFLVRFGYDRQLTDLKKSISKEVAVINSYTQIEEQYRLAQTRVNLAKPIIGSNERMLVVIDKLQLITPTDVWMERLTISPDSTSLIANASSLAGFSKLIRSLSSDKEFDSVSIGSLQDGAQKNARLQFDVSITYGATTKK